jgi:hypothetical protein
MNARAGTSRAPRLFAAAALAAWCVAYSAVDAAWMERNGFFERPFSSDAAWYRIDALRMRNGFDAGGVLGWLKAGLDHDRAHPPLVIMVAGLVAALRDDVGVSQRSAHLAIQLFGALFVFGAYRLARNFRGRVFSWSVAALATCLVGAGGHWRPLYPQFPMSALLVWVYDAILRSDGFRRAGASAAVGAWAGFATLAKMLAPLYFAGASLAALAFGLARKDAPLRRIAHAALALAVAAAIAAPWYVLHSDRVFAYADEVTGDEGQAVFSSSIPKASVARWLFYPWHALNGGAGLWFAPLLLVAAATGVAAWVRAARGRGPEDPAARARLRDGAIVAAAPAVAYVPLTLGQTAAGAFYLSGYLAPLALAIASAVASRRRPVVRALLAAVAVAAAAGYRTLALRAPQDDRATTLRDALAPLGVDAPAFWSFASTPGADGQLAIDLVPKSDPFYGSFMGLAAATGRTPAEDWPNARIAALVADLATLKKPRFAQSTPFWHTHPYCGHPQILYEAELRGLRLDYRRPEEWIREGKDPLAEAARCDFVLVDERPLPGLLSLEETLAALRVRGAEGQVVLRERPTEHAGLALVAVRRPGAVFGARPAADLDAPDVRRGTATFANGWTLRGVRAAVRANGDPYAIGWFEPGPDAERDVEAVAYLMVDGKSAGSVYTPLRALRDRDAARPLVAVTFDGIGAPPPGARPVFHYRVTSRRPDAYKGFSRVETPDFLRRGNVSIESEADTRGAATRPVSRPASRPASRPVSRPASRPASRAVSPTSRPASKPAPR